MNVSPSVPHIYSVVHKFSWTWIHWLLCIVITEIFVLTPRAARERKRPHFSPNKNHKDQTACRDRACLACAVIATMLWQHANITVVDVKYSSEFSQRSILVSLNANVSEHNSNPQSCVYRNIMSVTAAGDSWFRKELKQINKDIS